MKTARLCAVCFLAGLMLAGAVAMAVAGDPLFGDVLTFSTGGKDFMTYSVIQDKGTASLEWGSCVGTPDNSIMPDGSLGVELHLYSNSSFPDSFMSTNWLYNPTDIDIHGRTVIVTNLPADRYYSKGLVRVLYKGVDYMTVSSSTPYINTALVWIK